MRTPKQGTTDAQPRTLETQRLNRDVVQVEVSGRWQCRGQQREHVRRVLRRWRNVAGTRHDDCKRLSPLQTSPYTNDGQGDGKHDDNGGW